MLGLYISDHPMGEYKDRLAGAGIIPIDQLTLHGDKVVTAAGTITQIKRIVTKNNFPMAFLTIEDPSGSVEVVIFSKVYDQCNPLVAEDALVAVKGKVTVKELEGNEDEEPVFEAKMLAETMTPLEKYMENKRILSPSPESMIPEGKFSLECHVVIHSPSPSILPQLKSLLEKEEGSIPVFLTIKAGGKTSVLALPKHCFVKDISAFRNQCSVLVNNEGGGNSLNASVRFLHVGIA
jgi:DNA polymerase-3 subunit alpha